MTLKLAILTTQTLHHAYFVREVASRFPVARAYCETATLKVPFETAHPFEGVREEFERQLWFGGLNCEISKLCPTEVVTNFNDKASIASLDRLAPDVVVVFGTGRLSPGVLDTLPRLALNLHGGDPERYRGLDSHLWAIYHSDFSGLTTTLHCLSPELDAGDVVGQGDIPISPNMKLHEIRSANAKVCVQLTLAALSAVSALGSIPSRRQRDVGRYYSFMPAALKEICRQRFEKYAACLPAQEKCAI